jgi:nifR3 family TIM-barrel protein
MTQKIDAPWQLGGLTLSHRLIQAPLAGYSCAPFRRLFNHYHPPAYCMSEMVSAQDILTKHANHSRYLYRHPDEQILGYQLSGTDPTIMQKAALRCEALGADLIDINCGCPKTKIRRKGAGSALLENPDQLLRIIAAIKAAIAIPLTIKIRLLDNERTTPLAQQIANAGADALVVHGRTYQQGYDVPSDWERIATIKKSISIPVIANGDIADLSSLSQAIRTSQCDAFMIGRAGTGKPWLYQQLLSGVTCQPSFGKRVELLIEQLEHIALIDGEPSALLQARSLVRYFFKVERANIPLEHLYQCNTLTKLHQHLMNCSIMAH